MKKNYNDVTNSIHNQHNSLFIKPVNKQEIIDIVTTCNSKKSLDYHNLSFSFIKNIIISISQPLTILINNIFLQGIFPNCLKIAKVTLLHKGGNYEDPSNFRPTSIVSQFSKIIEKLLKCRLNSFISKYSLINTSQYGFMNKISTEDALLDLTNSIITKKHKITSVISIDIKSV